MVAPPMVVCLVLGVHACTDESKWIVSHEFMAFGCPLFHILFRCLLMNSEAPAAVLLHFCSCFLFSAPPPPFEGNKV